MRVTEIKVGRSFTTKVSAASRTVTGIFSVFGVPDLEDDVVHPGSMWDSFAARRPLFFWQHDTLQPPIARVEGVRELLALQLPQELRDLGATGGAEVARKYLTSQRAEEVFEAIQEGALSEMSFGFNIINYDFATVGSRRIRNLRKLDVLETSDVNWGMMPATIANIAATSKARVTRGLYPQRHKSMADLEAEMIAMGLIKPKEARHVARLDAGMLALGAMSPTEYAVKQLYRGANGRH